MTARSPRFEDVSDPDVSDSPSSIGPRIPLLKSGSGRTVGRSWKLTVARPVNVCMIALQHTRYSSTQMQHAGIMKAVCMAECKADGVSFLPDSVEVSRIVEEADCEGVPVRFHGTVAKTHIPDLLPGMKKRRTNDHLAQVNVLV